MIQVQDPQVQSSAIYVSHSNPKQNQEWTHPQDPNMYGQNRYDQKKKKKMKQGGKRGKGDFTLLNVLVFSKAQKSFILAMSSQAASKKHVFTKFANHKSYILSRLHKIF